MHFIIVYICFHFYVWSLSTGALLLSRELCCPRWEQIPVALWRIHRGTWLTYTQKSNVAQTATSGLMVQSSVTEIRSCIMERHLSGRKGPPSPVRGAISIRGNGLFKGMAKNFHWIWVHTLARPLQKPSFYFIFWPIFWPVDSLLCFTLLSCNNIQLYLKFRTQTGGWMVSIRFFFLLVVQVLEQQTNHRPSHYHIMLDCWYDVIFYEMVKW